MISFISGSVRAIHIDYVSVEVGGVGVKVLVNASTSSNVTMGMQVLLFTTLVVREDSLTLFGFLSDEERSLFELVQTVSGIGPKVALSILGSLTPQDLSRAIATEDISTIEQVPGIGRKGAQRMILELKGKLKDFSEAPRYDVQIPAWRESLSSALISLGFLPRESDAAITRVVSRLNIEGIDATSISLSDLLKEALSQAKGARG